MSGRGQTRNRNARARLLETPRIPEHRKHRLPGEALADSTATFKSIANKSNQSPTRKTGNEDTPAFGSPVSSKPPSRSKRSTEQRDVKPVGGEYPPLMPPGLAHSPSPTIQHLLKDIHWTSPLHDEAVVGISPPRNFGRPTSPPGRFIPPKPKTGKKRRDHDRKKDVTPAKCPWDSPEFAVDDALRACLDIEWNTALNQVYRVSGTPPTVAQMETFFGFVRPPPKPYPRRCDCVLRVDFRWSSEEDFQRGLYLTHSNVLLDPNRGSRVVARIFTPAANRVRLPPGCEEGVTKVLEFLYTGRIEVVPQLLVPSFVVAQELDVSAKLKTDLTFQIQRIAKEQIAAGFAVEFFLQAVDLRCAGIVTLCANVILLDVEAVHETDFRRLTTSHVHQLVRVAAQFEDENAAAKVQSVLLRKYIVAIGHQPGVCQNVITWFNNVHEVKKIDFEQALEFIKIVDNSFYRIGVEQRLTKFRLYQLAMDRVKKYFSPFDSEACRHLQGLSPRTYEFILVNQMEAAGKNTLDVALQQYEENNDYVYAHDDCLGLERIIANREAYFSRTKNDMWSDQVTYNFASPHNRTEMVAATPYGVAEGIDNFVNAKPQTTGTTSGMETPPPSNARFIRSNPFDSPSPQKQHRIVSQIPMSAERMKHIMELPVEQVLKGTPKDTFYVHKGTAQRSPPRHTRSALPPSIERSPIRPQAPQPSTQQLRPTKPPVFPSRDQGRYADVVKDFKAVDKRCFERNSRRDSAKMESVPYRLGAESAPPPQELVEKTDSFYSVYGTYCVDCNEWRQKYEFTKSQWRNRPRGFRRCKFCTGEDGTNSRPSSSDGTRSISRPPSVSSRASSRGSRMYRPKHRDGRKEQR